MCLWDGVGVEAKTGNVWVLQSIEAQLLKLINFFFISSHPLHRYTQ